MHIVVLGGTLSALEAGVQLYERGCALTFALTSTFFGEDACGTWNALPLTNQDAYLSRINDILRRAGMAALQPPLLSSKIKKALLSAALRMNARILYMTRLAGIEANGARVTSALLCGKAGLTRVACQGIVDGTLYREFAFHLSGQSPFVPAGTQAAMLLEYRGNPSANGLLPGPLDAGHAFLPVVYAPSRDMRLGDVRAELMRCAYDKAAQMRDTAQLQDALPSFIITAPLNAPKCPYQNFVTPERAEDILETNARGETGERILLGESNLREADVMVAGGGTAGIWAAISAARSGVKTCLAEMFSTLGGTRALGGVFVPYAGNRSALYERMWSEMQQANRRVGSNIGATFLYHSLVRELGIELISPCVIWGAQTQGTHIRQVCLTGEDGGARVHAGQFIDATGDADIAVFAGVKTEIGCEEFGYVQNYSQAHRTSRTKYDVPVADQGVMRPDIPEEWTRAITFNTLNAADYDIREMLTVRESRRIKGLDKVTVRDIARGRRPADCIYSAYAIYDPHGRTYSDAGVLGVLPEHAKPRWTHVPLGALIPEGIDNMLVAGKAVSADQEGQNFMRQSADIMSIGHICGYLAAVAQKTGARADRLPEKLMDSFRETLYADGAIAFKPVNREEYETNASMLKSRILSGHEDIAFNDAALMRWPELPDMLKHSLALNGASSPRLAMEVLALYEAGEWCDSLLKDLDALLDEEAEHGMKAPPAGGHLLGGTNDDAGVYWHVNRIISLTAMRHVTQARTGILRAFSQARALGADWRDSVNEYMSLRPDRHTPGNYDRFFCLAHAARLMPDARYTEHIERLMRMLTEYPDKNFHMERLMRELTMAKDQCQP